MSKRIILPSKSTKKKRWKKLETILLEEPKTFAQLLELFKVTQGNSKTKILELITDIHGT